MKIYKVEEKKYKQTNQFAINPSFKKNQHAID